MDIIIAESKVTDKVNEKNRGAMNSRIHWYYKYLKQYQNNFKMCYLCTENDMNCHKIKPLILRPFSVNISWENTKFSLGHLVKEAWWYIWWPGIIYSDGKLKLLIINYAIYHKHYVNTDTFMSKHTFVSQYIRAYICMYLCIFICRHA